MLRSGGCGGRPPLLLRSRRFRPRAGGAALKRPVDPGPVTLLVVVASRHGQLTNVWILGGYQSDFARNLHPRRPRLRRPDRRGRRRHARARPRSTPPTSRWSTSATPSASCSPARATSARCPPPSTTACGTPRRPATKPRARRAASRRWPRWPTSVRRLRRPWCVGVELEKTVPGDTAAQHLGAAAWIGHEGADAKFMWPHMFDRVADEYDRRYGLDDDAPRAIAAAELRQRPHATRTRRPASGRCPTSPGATPTTRRTPSSRARIRRFDCSQMTDGGAGVVLVTDDYLRDHPGRAPDRPHRRLGPPHRRAGPAAEARPRRRRALRDARTCAAPCSTRSTAPASRSTTSTASRCTTASPRASTSRSTTSGSPARASRGRRSRTARSRSADGCRSTPAAASSAAAIPSARPGVRMLRRRRQAGQRHGAGDYQVEGATTFGTLNFGGSTATTVSFVVHAESAEESQMNVRDRRQVSVDAARGRRPPVPHRAVAAADHRVRRRRPRRRRGRDPRRPRRRLPAQHREPGAPVARALPPVRRRRHAAHRRLPRRTGRSTATASSAPTGSQAENEAGGPLWPGLGEPVQSPSATTAGARGRG